METVRLTRKPIYIDGVQVTEDNIDDVAIWCDGKLKITESDKSGLGKIYIKVMVERPQNDRQTTAYPGDWVIRTPNGFKVYTKRALGATFLEVEEEVCGLTDKTANHKPCVLGRGHLSYTTCRSLTDYKDIHKVVAESLKQEIKTVQNQKKL